MTNKELKKEWEARVAAFMASGQSTKEWCAAQNLKINQLRYWLRKLKPADTPIKPQTSKWMSVEISEVETKKHDSSLPIKVGKATIEVKPGFDPVLLSEVVKTLAAL